MGRERPVLGNDKFLVGLARRVDVNKICLRVKDKIRQDLLPSDTAAWLAKLFYLLLQSLAWGLE